jgi:hypothetical protein
VLQLSRRTEPDLVHIRKSTYYSPEELHFIRRLRENYRRASIEQRREFFEMAYKLWFDELPLPREIGPSGEKVWYKNLRVILCSTLMDRCFVVH